MPVSWLPNNDNVLLIIVTSSIIAIPVICLQCFLVDVDNIKRLLKLMKFRYAGIKNKEKYT